MSTNSRRCWENKKSKRHDKREYFLNTESGVSQWGRQDKNDPLPAGWEYCISKSKKPFYYNLHSKLAQWRKPTEADKLPVPKGFEEKRSKKCKNVYYVNLETGKTQWEYPEEKETRGNEDSHFELIEDEDPIGTVYRLKKPPKISLPDSESESESGSDVSYSHPDLDRRTERVLKTRGSKNIGRETSSDEDEKWYDEYEDETRFGADKKFIRKGIKNKANQRRTPTRKHKKEMQKIKRSKNKFAKKEDEVVKQELIRHDSEDSLTDQSVDQDEIDRLYQIYDKNRTDQEDLQEDEDLYKRMEKDLDDERRNFQEDLQEDEDLYKRMEKDLDDERRNFQQDLKDKDILSKFPRSQDVGFGGEKLVGNRTYQEDLNDNYKYLQDNEELVHNQIKDVYKRRNFQEDLKDKDILSQIRGSQDVGFGGFGDKNVARYRTYQDDLNHEDIQSVEDLHREIDEGLDDGFSDFVEQELVRHDSEDSQTDESVDQDEIDRRYQIYRMEKDLDDERRNFQEDLKDQDILSQIRGSQDVGFGDKNLARDRTYQDDLNHEYFQDILTQTRGSKDVRRETRFGAGKKFLDKEIKGKAIQKRSLRNHKKEMHLRDKNKKLHRLISLMNEERDKDTKEYQELRNIIQETREEISRLKKQIDTNEESEDTPLSPSESDEEPENFHDAPMFNFNQSKTIANDEDDDDDDFKDLDDFITPEKITEQNRTFGEFR